MSRAVIALPSKGRLKDQVDVWLAARGLRLVQTGGARGYSAALEGFPDLDVRLVSAREIALGLVNGSVHAGITGEDLLFDLSSGAADVTVAGRLGFGGARLIVAVPACWVDVDTMADLEVAGAAFRKRHNRRLRVATKYLFLTRQFFAQRSVGDYRLVESAGATEAAPATGSADAIVDITSSGATLVANGLKVLSDGLILDSEAAFALSHQAAWSAAQRSSVTRLLEAVQLSPVEAANFLRTHS